MLEPEREISKMLDKEFGLEGKEVMRNDSV